MLILQTLFFYWLIPLCQLYSSRHLNQLNYTVSAKLNSMADVCWALWLDMQRQFCAFVRQICCRQHSGSTLRGMLHVWQHELAVCFMGLWAAFKTLAQWNMCGSACIAGKQCYCAWLRRSKYTLQGQLTPVLQRCAAGVSMDQGCCWFLPDGTRSKLEQHWTLATGVKLAWQTLGALAAKELPASSARHAALSAQRDACLSMPVLALQQNEFWMLGRASLQTATSATLISG